MFYFGWILYVIFIWICNIGCKLYVDSCKDFIKNIYNINLKIFGCIINEYNVYKMVFVK